jgi:hypothetical protein
MMLAKHLDYFWSGTIGTVKASADVGPCYQVRATDHPKGKLLANISALRLCLDRIFPARKDRPVSFTLPSINSAQDAAALVCARGRGCPRDHDDGRCRGRQIDRQLREGI